MKAGVQDLVRRQKGVRWTVGRRKGNAGYVRKEMRMEVRSLLKR